MGEDRVSWYSELLENVARELDIPPSKYVVAVQRYTSMREWLEEGAYPGCYDAPTIYPQGSIRLGTIVRPIREGKEADYDVDLVCELQKVKQADSAKSTKTAVGDRIRENATYLKIMDEEGRRCWTLDYAEDDGIGFHLDVLPSVPEERRIVDSIIGTGVPPDLAQSSIAITHRSESSDYCWLTSNPNGYAAWFESVQSPVFQRVAVSQKESLLKSNPTLFRATDDVPNELVRTPLQRAIQLLKRHRDLRFAGHELEEYKPISVVITTASARLYRQEADTYSALKGIVEALDAYSGLLERGARLDQALVDLALIRRTSDDKWYMPNPVNPGENFADRWHEDNHRRARAFFLWAAWVRGDLIDLLQGSAETVTQSLQKRLGDTAVKKAAQGLYAIPAIVVPREKAAEPLHIERPMQPYGQQC